jgi:hypothetical protein
LERIRCCLLFIYLFVCLFIITYWLIDIHHLNAYRPRAILDIIKSGENFRISTTTKMPEQGTCERCGYISSQVFSSILRHFWFIWAQWICILMGLSFSPNVLYCLFLHWFHSRVIWTTTAVTQYNKLFMCRNGVNLVFCLMDWIEVCLNWELDVVGLLLVARKKMKAMEERASRANNVDR